MFECRFVYVYVSLYANVSLLYDHRSMIKKYINIFHSLSIQNIFLTSYSLILTSESHISKTIKSKSIHWVFKETSTLSVLYY